MTLQLRDYQDYGVKHILAKKRAFLMWDMGLGKTVTVLKAIEKSKQPAFIIAPLTAVLVTWPDEIQKWTPQLKYCILHGSTFEHVARHLHLYDIILINFEGLIKWRRLVYQRKIKLRKYFLVVDESSWVKNFKSKRWEIIAEALPIFPKYRVCLSGTPAPNSLLDLWAQYFILDEGRSLTDSFYRFRSKYFNFSGAPRYLTTIKKGAAQRIHERIAPRTYVIKSSDELNLPELVYNNIHLKLPIKLRRVYDELSKEFQLQLSKTDFVIANSSAVLQSKLRQFLQGGVYYDEQKFKQYHMMKAQAFKDIQSTGSMLCMIQFRFEYDLLCKVFNHKLPLINGSVSAKVKQKIIRQWNNRELPVLVCQPRSVAFSLNLQEGGHHICWLALPWELDVYKQMIKRLLRHGQKHNRVIVHTISFKDTVDSRVAKVLGQKNATQEQLFQALKEV